MLKILEVFTKQYRQETKHREFLKENRDKIKLKDESHKDYLKGIQSLADKHFESNFHIKTNSNSEKNAEGELER